MKFLKISEFFRELHSPDCLCECEHRDLKLKCEEYEAEDLGIFNGSSTCEPAKEMLLSRTTNEK